ncbi:hypothetical protein CEXT_106831 [Caerostris extrusa]|uniref:Uncharacterized protein n=1 Tax=Caerostris extrusa TaxID=172846 RepID=A0AAV4SP66_CAEEX|nr:hypothetical protein CEXT_106831 [Caerostris extrusa]
MEEEALESPNRQQKSKRNRRSGSVHHKVNPPIVFLTTKIECVSRQCGAQSLATPNDCAMASLKEQNSLLVIKGLSR